MTKSVSRLTALALLGLLLIVAWLVICAPILARHDALTERLAAANAQIERFTNALGSGAAAPRLPPDLVFGPSSVALASADLQRMVEDAVGAAGGTRRSIQPEQVEETEAALRLSVTLDAAFDTPALAEFLRGVETARPLLFVDALEVQSSGSGQDGDALSVRTTIAGFLEADEAAR